MADAKTKPTTVSVEEFIAAVPHPGRREDARALVRLMAEISGEPAVMWGPSIIGFGRYHYRYDSGRTGEACRIGFSPRKGQTVLYLLDGHGHRAAELARLGKHKTGKSCLYIKRLSDIDQTVLDKIIASSLAFMAQKYLE